MLSNSLPSETWIKPLVYNRLVYLKLFAKMLTEFSVSAAVGTYYSS